MGRSLPACHMGFRYPVTACVDCEHRQQVVPACVCRSRPVSVSPHNFCGWPTGVRVSPIGLFSGFELVLEPPNLRDISGFPVSRCFCPSLPAPRADGRLSTESLVSSQPHGPLPQGASDFACFCFCGTRHGAGGCRPCGPGLYSFNRLLRSGALPVNARHCLFLRLDIRRRLTACQ